MHRSTAVSIFGTLNIVFSVFTLLGVFNALVVQFRLSFIANDSKSLFSSLMGSPAYVRPSCGLNLISPGSVPMGAYLRSFKEETADRAVGRG
jgi:hypothetical protein